jgi:hypothetical protein
MAATLTIRDETTFSFHGAGREFTLALPEERISVRELIRTRVYEEVRDYNLRQEEYFHGLVQPSDAEVTLNGYRMRAGRQIDVERQFKKALLLFQRNGFLILVDDRQVEELDEVIRLRPETTITFLKLIPLVGG